MIQYSQIPIPPRSEHLWRYTPWKRIHPTKVEDIPESDLIKFSEGIDYQMDGSDEISRHFFIQYLRFAKRSLSTMSLWN